ncbi:hypothetical protein BGLA2_2100015 [Burkholderia gladioli]|nr:hypothetical protein BGLA2_2100015 [Burkholderia gladioli]
MSAYLWSPSSSQTSYNDRNKFNNAEFQIPREISVSFMLKPALDSVELFNNSLIIIDILFLSFLIHKLSAIFRVMSLSSDNSRHFLGLGRRMVRCMTS